MHVCLCAYGVSVYLVCKCVEYQVSGYASMWRSDVWCLLCFLRQAHSWKLELTDWLYLGGLRVSVPPALGLQAHVGVLPGIFLAQILRIALDWVISPATFCTLLTSSHNSYLWSFYVCSPVLVYFILYRWLDAEMYFPSSLLIGDYILGLLTMMK